MSIYVVAAGHIDADTFIQNCGLMVFDYDPKTGEFFWTDYINTQPNPAD